MEWLVLILLVPLILLPVIALTGFAGCDRVFGLEVRPPENPPTDLVATALGVDRIGLSWTDNSMYATHFRIRRRRRESPFSDDAELPFLLEGEVQVPATTYEDSQGLAEGEYYEYQVFASNSGGESAGSNIDGERTLAWRTAFDQGLNVGVPGPVRVGRCVVQRIPMNHLAHAGSAVRITVRGSSAGPLQLNAVFISKPDPDPTRDAWDSAGDLVPVLFRGGRADILVGTAQTERSDETPYMLEASKDLIVAFDVGTPGQVDRMTGVAGAQAYFRTNPVLPQAGVPDRLSDFQPEPEANAVLIVEKIEALVKIPD